MKRKRILTLIACILLLMIIAAGVLASSTNIQMNLHIISGGGGTVQSGSHHLQHSIGQANTGSARGGSYQLGSGFWPGVVKAVPPPKERYLFLPMVTAK